MTRREESAMSTLEEEREQARELGRQVNRI